MNLDKLPRALNLTVFCALAAAVLLGVFQTIVMLTCYEYEVMLYYRDSLPPVIINILYAVVTAAICAAVFLTSRKKQLPNALGPVGTVSSFFGAVAAFLIIGTFAVGVYSHLIVGVPIATSMPVQRLFIYARIFLAIPAGVCMLVIALGRRPSRNVSAILGFFLVMWLAMSLIGTHFDMTTPLNSPPKVLTILGYTALMLSSLYAMRFDIGRPKTALYIAVSLIASVFGIAASFPQLVMTALGRLPLEGDTMAQAAQLALSLYTAARICEPFGHAEEAAAPGEAGEEGASAADQVPTTTNAEENANEK